jgi:hypothetical protein
MAKKEQEMYEGMPVIEASDSKGLKKKLEKLESRPEKYVVKISNRSTKIKAGAFMECEDVAALIIPDSVTEIGECAFEGRVEEFNPEDILWIYENMQRELEDWEIDYLRDMARQGLEMHYLNGKHFPASMVLRLYGLSAN